MEGDIPTTSRNRKIFSVLMLFMSIIARVRGGDEVEPTEVTDAKQKGAVCLDGTPAIYFHGLGSGEGVNNWIIILGGGGWCRSEGTCAQKVKEPFGTSLPRGNMNFTGMLSSNQTSNPDFYSWNKVSLHYCDGGSFLGDTEQVTSNHTFQLRGTKIFDTVMEELMAKGMQNATNALLAGGSAGGLASMLHCDIFAALLPKARVKCLTDAGFFLRAPDLPYIYYRDKVFVEVLEYRNLTNKLPITCTSSNASLCLFPEYFVQGIKTPLFITNSAFDSFQVHDNLQPAEGDYPGWRNCTDHYDCKPSHKQVVMDFGKEFVEVVKKAGDKPTTGMFISSCYVHGFFIHEDLWNSDIAPRLENKTVAQVLGDWYFDRNTAKLIDPSDFLVKCRRQTDV